MSAKFTTLLFLLTTFMAIGQGKLVMIGGGGEDYGSWSDAPYQWAVEHSANKRVAIIAYGSATNWIPDYFVSLGAVWAKNFNINSATIADAQATYDSLVTYDVVFLKGGDQSDYYLNYQNSKTQLALQHIYNNGGVLCGTSAGCAILSPIVYTALTTSVMPVEALTDFNDPDITLANDFLNTLSQPFIFDTHFAERGRIARLRAFMRRWYADHNELAYGIGVDDHTAITIDENGIGTVMGSGAVTILTPSEGYWHDVESGADVLQMLDGDQINLTTMEGISSNSYSMQTMPAELDGIVLLSASNDANENKDMICHLINQIFQQSDSLVLLHSGATTTVLNTYAANIAQCGGGGSVHVVNIADGLSDAEAAAIQTNHKFLIVSCDFATLRDLIESPAGSGLYQQLHSENTVKACDADAAMYVGSTYVSNCFDDYLNSWYGDLTVEKGLGLMRSIGVMSPTWPDNSDFYENTVTGLTYAMVKDSLSAAVALVQGPQFVEIYNIHYLQFTGDPHISVHGSEGLPAWFIRAKDFILEGALCSATYLGDNTPRNIAGISNILITELQVGNSPIPIWGLILPTEETAPQAADIVPNPSQGSFKISWADTPATATIFDMHGREIWTQSGRGSLMFDATGLPTGTYLVRIIADDGRIFASKMVKL